MGETPGKVRMQIVCGRVDEVALDPHEVCRRLQIPRGFESEGMDSLVGRCVGRLKEAVDCRYAYVRVPVEVSSSAVCRFDFGEVESMDLSKNLRGCTEAFVFAVTLGIGVDRLLHRLNLLSQAEHFITDALASAAAEGLCDGVNGILASSGQLRPRFSPGYGDVPLSFQAPLLGRLRADATLGITLNGAYLMTPMKSITAIVGIL